MTPQAARQVAVAGLVVVVGLVTTGVALPSGTRPTAADVEALFVIAHVTFILSYAGMGSLVAARRPPNAIGWILLAIGLGQATGVFAYEYAAAALTQTLRLPGGELMRWVANWIWAPTLGLMVTFLLLLFPDGRLPSRGWRPLAWLSAAGIVVGVIALQVTVWPVRHILEPVPWPESPALSTFIVECRDDTWRAAGMDRAGERDPEGARARARPGRGHTPHGQPPDARHRGRAGRIVGDGLIE